MDRNQFFSTYFDQKKLKKKLSTFHGNTLENDPLGVLKTGCGHNLWIEISFFQTYFDQKKLKKKTFNSSWQYLENDPLGVLKPVVGIIYG